MKLFLVRPGRKWALKLCSECSSGIESVIWLFVVWTASITSSTCSLHWERLGSKQKHSQDTFNHHNFIFAQGHQIHVAGTRFVQTYCSEKQLKSGRAAEHQTPPAERLSTVPLWGTMGPNPSWRSSAPAQKQTDQRVFYRLGDTRNSTSDAFKKWK